MDLDYAGDLTPKQAWTLLKKSPEAVLIDVRTQPEWAFVGIPNLSSIDKKVLPISWQMFPKMNINSRFIVDLTDAGLSSENHLCFLCRSGVRSVFAAKAAAAAGFSISFNISSGFEGDLDEKNQRGNVNGWRFEGLPWEQG
jgi:rhodanese-related sulfurtransferase